ncbi:hypothetical protein HYV82_01135 [Candidatus Woesearchaeota archaeon]|nr:hypothetical protein [Candidatus Woesearchaeota archaeon]
MADNGANERKERGLSEIERKELLAVLAQMEACICELTTATVLLAKVQTPRTQDVVHAVKFANSSASRIGDLGQKMSVIGALLKNNN